MSIDRQYNEVVFTCDECGDDIDTGMEDFEEALEFIKDEGWLVTKRDKGPAIEKTGKDWIHVCPTCIGPEREIK